MTVDDIRKDVDGINYNEVASNIRQLIEDDDNYADLIIKSAEEEGGTPAEKITELLEEIMEHRIENIKTPEAIF